MPDTSPRLDLPYLQPSQAQKHITHNEALQGLDTLVQLSAEAVGATEPPAAPAEGEVHVLGTGATGAWAGQDGAVATWEAGAWRFRWPRPGWRVWDLAGEALRIWTGSAWVLPPAAPVAFENLPGVGIGTASDATNLLAVAAAATLFSHAGAGHRVTVNKAAAGDTASLLFQSGWSGRAEIGLAGSEALSFKVSADGGTWQEALRFDGATGALAAGLRFPATPAPVAGANTLDCYAEGAWTPVFGTDGNAPAGSDVTATGGYVKVGRLVLANFSLTVADKGSGGSGTVVIGGLPFQGAGRGALSHPGITLPGGGGAMGLLAGTDLAVGSGDGTPLGWSALPAGGFGLGGSLAYIADA